MTGCPCIKSLTFGESGTVLVGLSTTNNELEIAKTAGSKAMKFNALARLMGY